MHYSQNNHATRLLIANNVGSKSIAHIGNASWKHGDEVGSFPNRVYERDVNRNWQNVRSIENVLSMRKYDKIDTRKPVFISC